MARYPGSEAVYEVANLFRERCLKSDSSLLWPSSHAWKIENIEHLWDAFAGHPDPSDDSFMTKWERQLNGLSLDIHRVAVDILALYALFPSGTSTVSKQNLIGDTIAFALEASPPDEQSRALLEQAYKAPVGLEGVHYNTQRWVHITFYMGFARALKKQKIDPYDSAECRILSDETVEQVKEITGHRANLSRNMLLHLLFPDDFERISSPNSKLQIFEALIELTKLPKTTDVDEGLRAIREYLLSNQEIDDLDFWDEDIVGLWNKKTANVPKKLVPESDQPQVKSTNPAKLPTTKMTAGSGTLDQVSDTVLLPKQTVQELNDLLMEKQHLIFEGPPGSGKTFVAEKFARWFTEQPIEGAPLDEHVEIVQFHQSYGYENFVQGIRPETNNDGQLVYRVRDGIFLDMVERAKANPKDRFVLIIDEINRGNLSRIFGELLLLLEYRNQSVRLPYGSGDSGYLSIPENLFIIGTMNTADRSLAQIDYALRRRFYFVRFMPVENGRAEVFERWLEKHVGTPADRERLASLFRNLNHGIRQHLGTDDLQVGHSYFMQKGIETDIVFDRVWHRAVRPLLEEYLHHHRNRDEILAALTPDTLLRAMSLTEDDFPSPDSRPDAV